MDPARKDVASMSGAMEPREEAPGDHPGTLHDRHRDYEDPTPVPFADPGELMTWSLWRAAIAEHMAVLIFTYIGVQTIIGNDKQNGGAGVGTLGIAWAFGATIFVLVYCIGGLSGGHINPAVTFGLLLGRRISLLRALVYWIAQSLGAILGASLVKSHQTSDYDRYGGGTNVVAHGYTKGAGLVAELIGAFFLVYVVFSATDAKRKARDAYVPVLAPLAIGFTIFAVHLATIPITGTGINPARTFGPAVVWHHHRAFDDLWVFIFGPLLGAALAAAYHQYLVRAIPFPHKGDRHSSHHTR